MSATYVVYAHDTTTNEVWRANEYRIISDIMRVYRCSARDARNKLLEAATDEPLKVENIEVWTEF
jgi:hypothetical protein